MSDGTKQTLLQWFGFASVLPAVYLPLYNQLLHGGRDAASIIPRSGEYATVHVIAGICAILLIFGITALYLRIADKAGRFGLLGFMLAVLGQGMYAGELFIDGFFNPMLSTYDPVLQTNFHSAHYLQTPLHILGAAFFFVPLVTLVLCVGYVLFGIALGTAAAMPKVVGPLFAIAGVLLGAALFELQWIETIGYAALGAAIVWGTLIGTPIGRRPKHRLHQAL